MSRSFKKPASFDANTIVIGAGSAGLVSAYISAAVKAKVFLIERHKMGGDCLNTGCVPSKALIRSAKFAASCRHAEDYGFENFEPQIDFAKIMQRVHKVVAEIEPHDSVERYTELGVDCVQGEAEIISPYEVKVRHAGEEKILTAKNIIIASGARPFVPPIPGLDNVDYLTSDTVWEITEQPKRLLVVGGGPIGCELSQAFARLGTQVTQVQRDARIMPREDVKVSEYVKDKMQSEGVNVLTGHNALRFENNNGVKKVICEHAGQEVEIEFDQVLLAVGRTPNIFNMGLENLGIETSKRGTVLVNDYLQVPNYKNIYVCGDVAGPYQFTHAASHQAWYAAVNSLFGFLWKFKADYRVMPWATFTDPEVARVGLSEMDAQEQGIDYQLTEYGIDDLDRAIADGEARGFVRVITAGKSDKILGVTIVGSRAAELLSEFVLAMKHGLGLNKILGTIHPYPTWTEANKYAAGEWKRANAPEKILALLQKFHAWRRK